MERTSAGQMAQLVKALATRPGDLSLIPGMHAVKRKSFHSLHSDLHTCGEAHAYRTPHMLYTPHAALHI